MFEICCLDIFPSPFPNFYMADSRAQPLSSSAMVENPSWKPPWKSTTPRTSIDSQTAPLWNPNCREWNAPDRATSPPTAIALSSTSPPRKHRTPTPSTERALATSSSSGGTGSDRDGWEPMAARRSKRRRRNAATILRSTRDRLSSSIGVSQRPRPQPRSRLHPAGRTPPARGRPACPAVVPRRLPSLGTNFLPFFFQFNCFCLIFP